MFIFVDCEMDERLLLGCVNVLAACSNTDVLELLCQRGADVSVLDDDGATTLHYAAQLCSSHPGDSPRSSAASAAAGLATLRVLLASGIDPDLRDEDGRTPLMWAATTGNGYLAHRKHRDT